MRQDIYAPGTKVCCHCPLSEIICETSDPTVPGFRQRITPPRCLQDYAIWKLNRILPSESLAFADSIIEDVAIVRPDGILIDVKRYKAALQAKADELSENLRTKSRSLSRWERDELRRAQQNVAG